MTACKIDRRGSTSIYDTWMDQRLQHLSIAWQGVFVFLAAMESVSVILFACPVLFISTFRGYFCSEIPYLPASNDTLYSDNANLLLHNYINIHARCSKACAMHTTHDWMDAWRFFLHSVAMALRGCLPGPVFSLVHLAGDFVA